MRSGTIIPIAIHAHLEFDGVLKMTQWGINFRMQTVAETPTFSRQADKLFDDYKRRELIDLLAKSPLSGEEIPGTGGVRKLRFAVSGRGKRGGARVIYFYGGEHMPIYALLAYSKASKTDMTPQERRAVAILAGALKTTLKDMK